MTPHTLLFLAAFAPLQEPASSPVPRSTEVRREVPAAPVPRPPRLELVGRYDSGLEAGTEIVGVQASTRRAVVSLNALCQVDVLDLARPEAPTRLARLDLLALRGEELTSIAIHPSEDWFLAVLEAKGAWERGRLLAVDATTGAIWAEHLTGIGPDSVVIDPTGRFAIVANEGEEFTGKRKRPRTPVGSLTIVDLSRGRDGLSVVQLPLPDATGTPGVTGAGSGRFLERGLDGEEVLIPMGDPTPEWLEPEYVAFGPDGTWAWVVLQESNALARVELVPPRVSLVVGCGTTEHAADLVDDGVVRFDSVLRAFREPDGLTVTKDGRFVVTADEGDTEPGPDVEGPGDPAGGGRTVSVFDAETGVLVGDTGNQIDAALHALGHYDDKWSPKGGSEPENVVAFRDGETNWVVAGLEDGNALALISLANPAAPRVVDVALLPQGSASPEGLALYERDGDVLVLNANEDSGDVTLFRFVR